MLPRNPADYRALLWALLMPVVVIAQFVNPKLIPYLSPLSFYFAMAAGTMAHKPQSLPDVQEPESERALRELHQHLLRLPDVRVGPDAQPESPQARQPRGRRDDHVASLEAEHVVDRGLVLLHLVVLPVDADQGIHREGEALEPEAPQAHHQAVRDLGQRPHGGPRRKRGDAWRLGRLQRSSRWRSVCRVSSARGR